MDLSLGITVLTFHDGSGDVIATTPTQQQLNTYLLFGASAKGGEPAGRTGESPGLAMLA